LKQALAEAPVLAFPNFTKEFIIITDASAEAIGTVMMQGALLGNFLRDHRDILAFPNFTKEFIIITDASAEAIGTVMMQGEPFLGNFHRDTFANFQRGPWGYRFENHQWIKEHQKKHQWSNTEIRNCNLW
jgi:hypothetical protein